MGTYSGTFCYCRLSVNKKKIKQNRYRYQCIKSISAFICIHFGRRESRFMAPKEPKYKYEDTLIALINL